MGIKLDKRRHINAVEVISKNDDALDLEKSNWKEYEKTGDRSHLVFVENKQPTVFLCNFEVKAAEAANIKNSMIGGTDEDGKAKVSLGSWSFRIVKYTLKDIQNPADIPEDERIVMKKDDRGYAADELVGLLDRLRIVDEIFTMYTNLALGGVKDNAKN